MKAMPKLESIVKGVKVAVGTLAFFAGMYAFTEIINSKQPKIEQDEQPFASTINLKDKFKYVILTREGQYKRAVMLRKGNAPSFITPDGNVYRLDQLARYVEGL